MTTSDALLLHCVIGKKIVDAAMPLTELLVVTIMKIDKEIRKRPFLFLLFHDLRKVK